MSDIKITVRLPADLHEALTAIARDEDRSLNQQVIRFLREKVEGHGKGRR